MGRHSRRGPAPKGAAKEDTGERVPPARSGPSAPPTADGTPAHGVPLFPDGMPARGVPRLPDGTPAHGIPRPAGGTPARGVPRVRGGHPEQRESGGGWGELRGPTADGVGYGRPGAPGQGPSIPRQRQASARGPRQDYLDAFTEDDVFAPRTAVSALATDPYAPAVDRATAPRRTGTGGGTGTGTGTGVDDDEAPPTGEPAGPTREKSAKSRAFTGIAAAAVTTVLAVVVAGQVTGGQDDSEGLRPQSAAGQAGVSLPTAPSVVPSPSAPADVVPLTYAQKMAVKYPLSSTLKASGKFDAVPGFAKAPGRGRKYTYRVDVERGLGLDGELFAQAVQKTLNDNRSWAHDGARTFERIHSGKPDFVITLASPGTTADWCAKSGLDTTVDNVSCDSASTERVMINAYRWAQGSTTYGDAIHAYRQMLINHEVGHRLGHGHVTCEKDGALAPVMQQQTKFLDHDGIRCRPNPWAYPSS